MCTPQSPGNVLSVDQHVEAVYQIMAETLADGRPCAFPQFYGLLREVLRSRRPASKGLPWLMLPIFVCEALGGNPRHGQQVAAAFELGRIAAGCLDEWQDKDTENALWLTVGPERAVNAATGLVGLSFLAAARLAALGLPEALVLAVQNEFQLCLLHMCEGQNADLGDDLALGNYDVVAGAKAGTLFRLGCRAGAIVGRAPADAVEVYGEFGQNLGVVVQVWNDMEGLAGKRGKKDANHRRALPLLAAEALGQPGYEPRSAEGQAGELYALVRLQAYYRRAEEALARCPAQGRLTMFLENFSTRHLADLAAWAADPGEQGHAAPVG